MKKEMPEKKEISDKELVEALKDKGVENPEVFELLQTWTKQEENKNNTPEGSIALNIKRARLYIESGYVQEGLESMESASIQASNEQRNELYNQIVEEMNEIEGSCRLL